MATTTVLFCFGLFRFPPVLLYTLMEAVGGSSGSTVDRSSASGSSSAQQNMLACPPGPLPYSMIPLGSPAPQEPSKKLYRTPAVRRQELASASAASSPSQSPGALEPTDERRPRFACPIPGCVSCFASAHYLMTHVEGTHLSRPNSDDVVPDTFLRAYQRWISPAEAAMPLARSCPANAQSPVS